MAIGGAGLPSLIRSSWETLPAGCDPTNGEPDQSGGHWHSAEPVAAIRNDAGGEERHVLRQMRGLGRHNPKKRHPFNRQGTRYARAM